MIPNTSMNVNKGFVYSIPRQVHSRPYLKVPTFESFLTWSTIKFHNHHGMNLQIYQLVLLGNMLFQLGRTLNLVDQIISISLILY